MYEQQQKLKKNLMGQGSAHLTFLNLEGLSPLIEIKGFDHKATYHDM